MNTRISGRWAGTVAAILLTASVSFSASPVKLSGSLVGMVKDSSGYPQIGAAVLLFNGYDRLIQTAYTNLKGEFGFDALTPDTYSVRVNLASFVPAVKRNISIQPGMKSILAINVASMLSSVELVSSAPNSSTLMSDDWKWVLRSTMSTRPVLRYAPGVSISDPDEHHSVFSDTRGVLKVSTGEDNPYSALGNEADLGTTFALATSIYGRNKVLFSGNVGYGIGGSSPMTAFRTTFSRADTSAQVKLTVQQTSLPGHGAIGLGTQDNLPALRTVSVTFIDRAQITDDIDVEYGTSFDSITFLERLNTFSPFARVNYHLGEKGAIEFAYSSGAPPLELLSFGKDGDRELQQDLAGLSTFPRVSLRDGGAHVQRTQSFEMGYRIKEGSRTYSVGAYRETVRNGALTMMAPAGFYDIADLLPELSSRSSVFNIGNYGRQGYTASVTQDLGDDYSITMAYGRGGVLRTDGRELQSDDPDELRSLIHPGTQQWVTARASGVLPWSGTKFITSYEWTDYRSLTPGHVYLTQPTYPEAGLNIRLRQPIPSFMGLPGRLEATAELRNLLAQGYLGIKTSDSRGIILTNAPKAVRGGLSFIF